MRVFHGSNAEIKTPDLFHSRKNVDFGCGFYVTPLHEQAENGAKNSSEEKRTESFPFMILMNLRFRF